MPESEWGDDDDDDDDIIIKSSWILHVYSCVRKCLLCLCAAQHSNQSPVSLTSEASSPQPCSSPRNGTSQSNPKSLVGVHFGSITSSQTRVSAVTKCLKKKKIKKKLWIYFLSSSSSFLNFSLFFFFKFCICFFFSFFRAVWLRRSKDLSPCLR